MTTPPRFERYVAIGDSSTEGLDDPDGNGGYRGWANRLAERIAAAQGSLLYANLGIRGRSTRRIRQEQLSPAAAMRPDLVTLFSGTNDVVKPRFDAGALARDVEHMQRTLIVGGATVLTFTLPDLTPVLPLARPIAGRIRLLNETLRSVSASTGAVLVDLAAHPVASDPRLWSPDRLHANAVGHTRIAAALAHALGFPGTDETWALPLPPVAPPTARERLAAENPMGAPLSSAVGLAAPAGELLGRRPGTKASQPGAALKIWIDADAAPRDVKELVFRAAKRLQVPTVLVANQRLQVAPGNSLVTAVRVEGGPDVADRYIAEHAEAGDLVVTQDIPLAALLVPMQVAVLDPRGDEHTLETIGERLSMRDFSDQLRMGGAVTGGPPPFDTRARQAFAAALDRVLTRLLRSRQDVR